MSKFETLIDKAVADLGVAKVQGERYAEQALVQARKHILLAIDQCRIAAAQQHGHPNHKTEE